MKRRPFLTRLASGVIGLSFVNVEWIPTPPAITLSATAPLCDITTITAEYLRRLVKHLDHPGREFGGRFIQGHYQRGDHGLTEHLSIDMMVSNRNMERGINPETSLESAACAMAQAIDEKSLRVFGAVPILMPGDIEATVGTDTVTGLTVRGMRFYDYTTISPHWTIRFDILGRP